MICRWPWTLVLCGNGPPNETGTCRRALRTVRCVRAMRSHIATARSRRMPSRQPMRSMRSGIRRRGERWVAIALTSRWRRRRRFVWATIHLSALPFAFVHPSAMCTGTCGQSRGDGEAPCRGGGCFRFASSRCGRTAALAAPRSTRRSTCTASRCVRSHVDGVGIVLWC